MQAVSRVQTPSSPQAAALAHIITESTTNNIAALHQQLPDATRAAISEELLLLNDAHYLVAANQLNEAAALLDSIISPDRARYLQQHGFTENAGVLQCIPEIQEPTQPCGTGLQEPVVTESAPCLSEVHVVDTPCGTEEQLKPAEQLPACGTGENII